MGIRLKIKLKIRLKENENKTEELIKMKLTGKDQNHLLVRGPQLLYVLRV